MEHYLSLFVRSVFIEKYGAVFLLGHVYLFSYFQGKFRPLLVWGLPLLLCWSLRSLLTACFYTYLLADGALGLDWH